MRTQTTQDYNVIRAGALAGLMGGIAMAVLAMIVSSATGQDFFLPAKLISGTFLGVYATIGGFWSIVLGVGIHVVVSMGYGAIFAMLMHRRFAGLRWAIGAGLGYGVLVWAFMDAILMPIFNPVMNDRVALQPVTFFIEHLVFGACVGLTPLFIRRGQVVPIKRVEDLEIGRAA